MAMYLGLDAGGTKTAALLVDDQGMEIGRGAGGPGNIATNDDNVLAKSVLDAMNDAGADARLAPSSIRISAVCAGVAGYSIDVRRSAFHALLRRVLAVESVRLEPDYLTAWWGATGGAPGII